MTTKTLWNVRDIAQQLGVSRDTVRSWRRRHRTRTKDFPEPVAIVRGMPLYEPHDIMSWFSRAALSSQYGFGLAKETGALTSQVPAG